MAPDAVSAFAPGRVNLIGEHTDYNGGLALPFAIEQGVRVDATARSDGRIAAIAADLDESDEFELAGEVDPSHGWRSFVRGTAVELHRRGLAPAQGASMRIAGSVARGAGLSSSAAMAGSLSLALIGLAGAEPPPPWDLARLCSRVENAWVGAQTGLLDHLSSLCGRLDTALRIDFEYETLAEVALVLGDWRLVTLDSGERHVHASSGYNQRRSECAQACELLGISSLRHATEQAARELPAPLSSRALHVIGENARVEETVAALGRDDLEAVGPILDASHASLRDLYEVSTPALEAAVEALKYAGAIGARVVGGGFGGNILGLLPPGAVPPAGALEVRPSPGAGLAA